MKTFYKPGSWNAVCDVCGFTYKSDELKDRWDGLKVCSRDWEMRHPQDLIRGIPDDPSVPWSRPDEAQSYSCSIFNSVGTAGVSVAGCAVAGRTTILG